MRLSWCPHKRRDLKQYGQRDQDTIIHNRLEENNHSKAKDRGLKKALGHPSSRTVRK
jgi:hypothetical protein